MAYEETYDESRGTTILVDESGDEVEGYTYSDSNQEWVQSSDD